jgi:hypothetical protein
MDICMADECSSARLFYPLHTHLTIPVEVCDIIVDLLSDDLSTLRACATVCRAFLRRSRRYLFRCILLRDAQHGYFFVQTLFYDPSSADAVQELRLGKFGRMKWAAAVSLDLLPLLCSLKKLRLRGLEELLHPPFFHSLADIRHSLTTLSLTFCHLQSPDELKQFILALPYVEHLTLKFLSFSELRPIQRSDCHPSSLDIMISTLFIQETPLKPWLELSGFTQWIGSTSTPLSLECLYVRPGLYADISIIQNLVHTYRYTLHTLVLDFGCNLSFTNDGMLLINHN